MAAQKFRKKETNGEGKQVDKTKCILTDKTKFNVCFS